MIIASAPFDDTEFVVIDFRDRVITKKKEQESCFNVVGAGFVSSNLFFYSVNWVNQRIKYLRSSVSD